MALCLVAARVDAQRPVATVNINTEKLRPESREKLVNLKAEIENYINSKDWIDEASRYDIPVQIDIFFEQAQPTSFEDRYDARLVLSNGTDYQASDKRWRFAYQQGVTFNQPERFHGLAEMLDFYIYIMLGWEYDKLTRLGGTPYYQKASAVVQQSKFSEYFHNGWKERQLHIENILSDDQIPLRELEYFFLQARQWLRLDDRKTAGQYLRVILYRLKGLNREMEGLDRFYQLHHLDLARFLSLLQMRPELEELSQLDPANAATYQQFIDQIP